MLFSLVLYFTICFMNLMDTIKNGMMESVITEEQTCLNRIRRRVVRAVENVEDYSEVGYLHVNINNICYASVLDDDVAVEICTEDELLRNKLIKHLNVQYLNGKLRWLHI